MDSTSAFIASSLPTVVQRPSTSALKWDFIKISTRPRFRPGKSESMLLRGLALFLQCFSGNYFPACRGFCITPCFRASSLCFCSASLGTTFQPAEASAALPLAREHYWNPLCPSCFETLRAKQPQHVLLYWPASHLDFPMERITHSSYHCSAE